MFTEYETRLASALVWMLRKRVKCFHLLRIEPRCLGCPASSLVTVVTELPKWILDKLGGVGLVHLLRIELRCLGCLASSLVTVVTELPKWILNKLGGVGLDSSDWAGIIKVSTH